MELDKQTEVMFNFTQPFEKEKMITKKEKFKNSCINLKNKFFLIGAILKKINDPLIAFILFMLSICGLTLYFFIGTSNINNQNFIKNEQLEKKVLIENQHLIDNNKIEFDKITQVKEDKNIKMWNEQVSKLNVEDLEKISNFMQWHEDRNIDKLITLYWSLVYINEEESKGTIDMKIVNSTIKSLINRVNDHYSYRRADMYVNYKNIKDGNSMSVHNSYDGQNVSNLTLRWLQYEKTKSTFYFEEVNKLIENPEWGGLVKNPRAFLEYLEKNKSLIHNSKKNFLN